MLKNWPHCVAISRIYGRHNASNKTNNKTIRFRRNNRESRLCCVLLTSEGYGSFSSVWVRFSVRVVEQADSHVGCLHSARVRDVQLNYARIFIEKLPFLAFQRRSSVSGRHPVIGGARTGKVPVLTELARRCCRVRGGRRGWPRLWVPLSRARFLRRELGKYVHFLGWVLAYTSSTLCKP